MANTYSLIWICFYFLVKNGESTKFTASLDLKDQSKTYTTGEKMKFIYAVRFVEPLAATSVTVEFNAQSNYIKISSANDLRGVYINAVTQARVQFSNSNFASVAEIAQNPQESGYLMQLKNIPHVGDEITGEYTATVTGNVKSGMRIPSFLRILTHANGNPELNPHTVVSQNAFIKPADFSLTLPDETHFAIRQVIPYSVAVGLTPGSTYVEAAAIMPCSLEELEARMSVDELFINKSSSVSVANNNPIMRSHMNNSVSSVATTIIYATAPDSQDTDFNVSLVVHVEDYNEIQNGEELMPAAGFTFGSGILWIGAWSLYTNTTAESLPAIKSNLTLKASSGYNGILLLTLEACFSSLDESTAYARNITATIFVPSYAASARLLEQDVKARNTEVAFVTGKIQLSTAQVAFTMDTWIKIDLSLDADDPQYWKTHQLILIMDVSYHGRSGSLFKSNITYVSIDLEKAGKHKAERILWTKTTTGCSCPDNVNNKTCSCCHKGGCQCPEPNSMRCEKCSAIKWRCRSTAEEFSSESITELDADTLIICKPAQRYRYQHHGISCFKQEKKVLTGMDPVVSTVTLKHRKTRELYGVSNNGYGYVFSSDGGDTWKGVENKYYMAAKGDNVTYKKSTLKELVLYD